MGQQRWKQCWSGVGYKIQAGPKLVREGRNCQNIDMDYVNKSQAKINDRGIAALAYNVKLGTGATLGLGASLDTQNLSQAAHKVGASFTFEG